MLAGNKTSGQQVVEIVPPVFEEDIAEDSDGVKLLDDKLFDGELAEDDDKLTPEDDDNDPHTAPH